MRSLVVALLVVLMAYALVPAQAQGTFSNGVYDFESVAVGTTGTWTTSTALSATSIQSSVVGSTATFYAVGNSLLISRLVRNIAGQTMFVCIGASCTTVSNGNASAATSLWQSVIVPLGAGTNTVTINHQAGITNLDYFMVLSDPAGSFPTPVPTATVVPTATPASTTTPQPTPTPQPTATPYTLPGAVFAIDPSRRYEMVEGQITSVEYGASAADIHLGNLLTMLLMSLWGMFIFCLVMFWHKKWWR